LKQEKSMFKRTIQGFGAMLALAGSVLGCTWAYAQEARSALPMVQGEVHKVDAAGQKVTLRHGEIKNLDMPPMSMVFKVKDPAVLSQLKPGDRVQFTADEVNGMLTAVTLERIAP
jgi:Cu(I)/Ag(I) efflux system protein CusF